MVNLGTEFIVNEVGCFTPDLKTTDILTVGEIGYIVTNLKDIHQVRVGDTLTEEKNPLSSLPGYRQIQPMVYASIFPYGYG
jgi:GTP-binding protein LepA